MPACATSTQHRPIRTPWAICTRLSMRRAGADHRVGQSAAIDRAVGADFHIVLDDHPAKLRDGQKALRRDGEAETLLADPRARVNVDPVADQRVRDAGMAADPAIRADLDPVADHRQRRRSGSAADHRARADHGQRPDFGGGVDPRVGADHRGWDGRPARRRRRMEQRRDPRPGGSGLGGDDRDGGGGTLSAQIRMHDHRAGPGFLQRRQVFAVVEESSRPRPPRPPAARRHATSAAAAAPRASRVNHGGQAVRAGALKEAGIAGQAERSPSAGFCRRGRPAVAGAPACSCFGAAPAVLRLSRRRAADRGPARRCAR